MQRQSVAHGWTSNSLHRIPTSDSFALPASALHSASKPADGWTRSTGTANVSASTGHCTWISTGSWRSVGFAARRAATRFRSAWMLLQVAWARHWRAWYFLQRNGRFVLPDSLSRSSSPAVMYSSVSGESGTYRSWYGFLFVGSKIVMVCPSPPSDVSGVESSGSAAIPEELPSSEYSDALRAAAKLACCIDAICMFRLFTKKTLRGLQKETSSRRRRGGEVRSGLFSFRTVFRKTFFF
ncbi:hypothetical protein DIPPA_27966 [Diplonema papillatum]|nr:hypothetical protein DIPPA_27966 [Diplonema papillatum]